MLGLLRVSARHLAFDRISGALQCGPQPFLHPGRPKSSVG